MKAIVIGRHAPDFGSRTDVEVIEQQAITFDRSSLAEGQLWKIIERLYELDGDAILLQNAPGQVVAALMTMTHHQERGDVFLPLIGIVVSIPGERPEEITRKFGLNCPDMWDYGTYCETVLFANPRAKVSAEGFEITVTVTPPMRFKFSHVEWLTGDAAQNCID